MIRKAGNSKTHGRRLSSGKTENTVSQIPLSERNVAEEFRSPLICESKVIPGYSLDPCCRECGGFPGGVLVVSHTFGTGTEGDDGFAARLLHICMCFSTLARSLIFLKCRGSFFLAAHQSQTLGLDTKRLRSEGSHKGKRGHSCASADSFATQF